MTSNEKIIKIIVGSLIILTAYGSLITVAVLYDDVFTQVLIDVSIMVISTIIGYIYSKKPNQQI